MKYLKQFAVILSISLVAELLKYLIPLPVPASIYGLLLMLTGLMTHLIPLHAVEEAGMYLVEIMPVLFIPSMVGLLDTWDLLRPVLVPLCIIVVVSTVLVIGGTGLTAQATVRHIQRERGKS